MLKQFIGDGCRVRDNLFGAHDPASRFSVKGNRQPFGTAVAWINSSQGDGCI
jgi:hypothetical protein